MLQIYFRFVSAVLTTREHDCLHNYVVYSSTANNIQSYFVIVTFMRVSWPFTTEVVIFFNLLRPVAKNRK